jgi:integrase
MDKYKGSDRLLDVLEHYASTHYWTSKVDQKLKTIAAALGLPPISMYWARHSWATICAELDIPKETLSAALGHSASTVTDIYINFDRSKIDRANRKVLDYVLYNKKEQDMFELLRSLNEKMAKMA